MDQRGFVETVVASGGLFHDGDNLASPWSTSVQYCRLKRRLLSNNIHLFYVHLAYENAAVICKPLLSLASSEDKEDVAVPRGSQ